MIIKRFVVTSSILLLILISFNVNADKEPNNSYDESETLNNGNTKGNVYSGFISDKDRYYVESPSDGPIKVNIEMKEGRYIRLDLLDSTSKHVENEYSVELVNDGQKMTTEWPDPQEHDGIFLLVSGSGSYNIEVEYPENNNAQNFFTTTNIAIFLIIISIAVILIIATILFIKTTSNRVDKDKFKELEEDFDIPEAKRVGLLPEMNCEKMDEFQGENAPEASLEYDEESGLKHSIFE